MAARVLCSFDSPAAAREALPRALDLAAWKDAELSFLAVLRPERLEPTGVAAPRVVRRRAFLELALGQAAELAAAQGRVARIHLVPAHDLERESVSQAIAQGAGHVLVAEDRGLVRRPRVRRLSLSPARVAPGVLVG